MGKQTTRSPWRLEFGFVPVILPQPMSRQQNNMWAEKQVISQSEVNDWRKELHRDFERALAETKLPERPDHERVNGFLVKERREMAK